MQNWPTGQQAPGKVALAQAPSLSQAPPVPPHCAYALRMKVQPGCRNCGVGGLLNTAAHALAVSCGRCWGAGPTCLAGSGELQGVLSEL